jgi:hypothetical protein
MPDEPEFFSSAQAWNWHYAQKLRELGHTEAEIRHLASLVRREDHHDGGGLGPHKTAEHHSAEHRAGRRG